MKREWITDRDPGEYGDYIVSTNKGSVHIVHWCGGWNVQSPCSERKHEWKDVAAWMPIPGENDSRWRTDTPQNGWGYIAVSNGFFYNLPYFCGWNCVEDSDGSIFRNHEFTDVTRWMELPEAWKEE